MPSDRPGIEMRRQLLALLEFHGEREARRTAIPDIGRAARRATA
jgi:hypothetical protein